MAAVTLLGTQTFDTNSGTHTVTATPAVGDLIVLVVASTGNTANIAPTDNNSDGAGLYERANTCVKASSADTMQVWIRKSRIGSASSTVFSHAPGTSTGGGLGVFKVTSMTRTGANAARQSAVQSNQSAAGTPTPVLGVAALTGNPLIGAVFNATSAATMTPRSSPAYTERFDVGYATPTTGLEVMSIDSGETGTSIAWGGTSASAFCSIVVELDTSAVPAATFLPVNPGYFKRRNLTHHLRQPRKLLEHEGLYPPTPFYPSIALGAKPTKALRLRRSKFKLKRLVDPGSYPPTPSSQPDREIAAQFVTRRLPQRRAQTAKWVTDMAPTPPSSSPAVPATIDSSVLTPRRRTSRRHVLRLPQLNTYPATPAPPAAQPVAAWCTRQVKRAKATHRWQLVPMSGAEVIEQRVPIAATLAVPRVKRIEFKPRLVRTRPQVLYPPSTGPPVPPVEAWETAQRKARRRTRHKLLSLAPAPYAPRTPNNEPESGWRLARSLKRKPTKHRLLHAPDPPQATSAPVITQPEPSWRLVVRLWRKTLRRHIVKLRIPPETTTAMPPPPVPWPSWKLATVLLRRKTRHRVLEAPDPPQATTAPVLNQPPSAWRLAVALKLKRTKFRLRKLATPPESTVAPTPGQPEPAWRQPIKLFRKTLRRRLRKLTSPPEATTAPVPLGSVSSIDAADSIRRRATKRKLRTLVPAPVFPSAVPAPPQPESALDPAKAKLRPRSQHWLIPQPPAPVYPPTSTPITAVVAARSIKRKPTKHRNLLPIQPGMFTPTPTQAAWALKVALRRRATRHELLASPPPGQFKPTIFPLSAVSSIIAATSIRRRETRRRHRTFKQPILRPTAAVSAIGLTATVREVLGASATTVEVLGMKADVK